MQQASTPSTTTVAHQQSRPGKQAFVFDAYGTLFDVHAAAAKFSADIGPNWQQLSQTWRTKHLEYTWIHGTTGVRESFWNLAQRSLDYATALHGSISPSVRAGLLAAYRQMAPFPEVPAVLAKLRANGHRLAILSNGDPDMLTDAVAAAGLEGVFDAAISVVEANTFKPAAAVYGLAVNHLQCQASDISFISSNRWDVAGATHFGFTTYWLNRSGAPDEYPTLAPKATIRTLDSVLQSPGEQA